jgi:hypothetical protein
MKGVSHTIKLIPSMDETPKDRWRSIHGKVFIGTGIVEKYIWTDVISRMTAHLSTCSWRSEARIGFVGRNIPTSYRESRLGDMTPIK